MWALGGASPEGIEGKGGRLGKCSRGSGSTELIRRHGNVEKITTHLVCAVESEKGILACQGRFCIHDFLRLLRTRLC